MTDHIVQHPLIEKYEGQPETNGEETINSWAFASMIAHVATGRVEGDQPAAIEMAKDCIYTVSVLHDFDRLIGNAVLTDEGMMALINVINEGLEKKFDEAFKG